MNDRLKQTKKLFRKLIRDDKSVFYAVNRINKTLLNKAKKSLYKKDKIFYKYYSDLENKNVLYESDTLKSLFLFIHHLLNREKISTSRLPYTVSKLPLNFCMWMLPIFDFFQNL